MLTVAVVCNFFLLGHRLRVVPRMQHVERGCSADHLWLPREHAHLMHESACSTLVLLGVAKAEDSCFPAKVTADINSITSRRQASQFKQTNQVVKRVTYWCIRIRVWRLQFIDKVQAGTSTHGPLHQPLIRESHSQES